MKILLFLSAPCPPKNLTARVDCGTNNGNFSWAESSGAGFYTVEVTGEHGHVASCSSNDTSCAVKLLCGRSYSASLVASTDSCNSSRHTDISFDSGKIEKQTFLVTDADVCLQYTCCSLQRNKLFIKSCTRVFLLMSI